MLRIKLFLIILTFAGFAFMTACSDSGTDNNDNSDSEIKTYTSENIKTEGAEYYSFSEDTATSEKPQSWDITLTINSRTVEVEANSCVYFEVNTNPAIIGAPGIKLAKVAAASLDDVKKLPPVESFVEDDTLREAFIGKSWFDPRNNFSVRPDVYVIKTCSGNYALLQIKRFDFNFVNFQISNIYYDYKYNADGSADFSAAILDSLQSGDAYTQKRYFSFTDNFLDYGYGSWDLQFNGSAIWLGPNAQAKKLENTNILDVGVVSDADFTSDHLPAIMTDSWYDTDDTHHVIPNDYVYFVQTKDNKYVAFEITNYYDDQGNSGVFTIKWKYMTP
jgi:hypothetical protein